MQLLRARSTASSRFLPGLETLEDRTVPSTFTFNGLTGTLTLTGTAGKDAIVITDDGTNNAGAVKVTSNGKKLFTSGPTAGVNQVHTINVNTLNGDHDSVVYNLIGDMVANNRSVSARFGSGKGDTFAANVNGSLINSFLLLQATGGSGGDTLAGTMTGNLAGASFLGFLYKGGLGNDKISINATNGVNIDPLSQMTVLVDGGAGDDVINVGYEGQMQGALFLAAQGGAGNDKVSAKLVFDGLSTGLLFGPVSPNSGKAAAQVDGGGGNDRLSLEVDLSGALKAASAAEIDGGAGTDSCHAFGFVTGVFNCEKTF
jgi:hypothetical protein